METANDHSACVDAWMARAAGGLPSERLLEVFERAFAALWRRAQVTLGEVTLGAIVDRVLYSAVERHPILAPLQVESTGLRVEALHALVGGLTRLELAAGIRFMLTEFLTVLGNLTAEILTPALHVTLSNVAAEEADRDEVGATPARQAVEGEGGDDGEGAES